MSIIALAAIFTNDDVPFLVAGESLAYVHRETQSSETQLIDLP